jgi:hypothetical protein
MRLRSGEIPGVQTSGGKRLGVVVGGTGALTATEVGQTKGGGAVEYAGSGAGAGMGFG